MSSVYKAILVQDFPEACYACMLSTGTVCKLNLKVADFNLYTKFSLPKHCPLIKVESYKLDEILGDKIKMVQNFKEKRYNERRGGR